MLAFNIIYIIFCNGISALVKSCKNSFKRSSTIHSENSSDVEKSFLSDSSDVKSQENEGLLNPETVDEGSTNNSDSTEEDIETPSKLVPTPTVN